MLIYCKNAYSQGAKQLSHAIPAKRIRHGASRFKGRGFKTVINWGATVLPNEVNRCRVLNEPEAVASSANKLWFFQLMERNGCAHHCPEWTAVCEVAQGWSDNAKFDIVERHVLSGSMGSGIVVKPHGAAIAKAPLYTAYRKSSQEYRLHIARDENGEANAFDAARKIKDPGREVADWKIRTHNNGFIYQRGGIEVPPQVMLAAKECFNASGLDFGAFDVNYNTKKQLATVLECNTAPGLVGATVESYAAAFRRM